MRGEASDATLREGAVETTACLCCGAPTTVVSGEFDVGPLSAGWYTVGVTHAEGHLPLLRLYIGDWTEGAGPDERWGLRLGLAPDGPQLLDWSAEEQAQARPVFTPLMRAQILGTPMESQIWALSDLVLTRDSRL